MFVKLSWHKHTHATRHDVHTHTNTHTHATRHDVHTQTHTHTPPAMTCTHTNTHTPPTMTRMAPYNPARAVEAVPWISSLKTKYSLCVFVCVCACV